MNFKRKASNMPHREASRGFTLLEMMVSIAVLLVISGGIITAITMSQQAYGRAMNRSDMYENVRGVAELMAQEIGQAGLVSLPTPTPTLSAAVASSGVAQTVAVSSTTSMFVGESLMIDAGASEEQVTLTNVTATTITAIFAKSHLAAPPTPITALGVFPTGIVPPGAADGSTATTLNLFGDINADGTLVYVRYVCTAGTTAAPGTLSRSITTITPGVTTLNASQNLLSTLVANPNATPCFQYTTTPVSTFTSVSQLGITLTVQTNEPDPKTRQYSTMTKSFLNMEPRNVSTGVELATQQISIRYQQQPPNVALY